MLILNINGKKYHSTNYSAMIKTIQNNVSYDIINDEIEYTENKVMQDNNGVMDDNLYNEYFGSIDDEQYKEIVVNHLNKININYKISGKSEV